MRNNANRFASYQIGIIDDERGGASVDANRSVAVGGGAVGQSEVERALRFAHRRASGIQKSLDEFRKHRPSAFLRNEHSRCRPAVPSISETMFVTIRRAKEERQGERERENAERRCSVVQGVLLPPSAPNQSRGKKECLYKKKS